MYVCTFTCIHRYPYKLDYNVYMLYVYVHGVDPSPLPTKLPSVLQEVLWRGWLYLATILYMYVCTYTYVCIHTPTPTPICVLYVDVPATHAAPLLLTGGAVGWLAVPGYWSSLADAMK